MRNNSQNAGCMRRFPASHSCQPRMAQWMSTAASVCESPAASRAARTSSGEGFAEGPFGPRFGWLGIAAPLINVDACDGLVPITVNEVGIYAEGARLTDALLGNAHAGGQGRNGDFVGLHEFGDAVAGNEGHLNLQPLFLPRRGGLRCATHELNYTRIACNSKNYLQIFSRLRISPHNVGIERRPPLGRPLE